MTCFYRIAQIEIQYYGALPLAIQFCTEKITMLLHIESKTKLLFTENKIVLLQTDNGTQKLWL